MNVGIVSTHRAWTSESDAWARYHLSLGFTRLYVFADDGRTDRSPSTFAVDLTPCTQAYWGSQSSKHWYGDYLCDTERDVGTAQWGSPDRVMQRQILNVCAAIERALDDGIDWLLHIDDEYFWCPGTSVEAHFDGLDRAGVASAVYWNHEAVLLEEPVPACSKQRTLFKKSWYALTHAQRHSLPSLLPGKPYFASYGNGKSAARVMAGALPNGVHAFHVDNSMLGQSRSCIPGVLHRPYKSVSQFCDKHLSQGEYSTELVFGQPWTPPGVYAEAQHLSRNNDRDGLRSLYARAVTLSEAERDRLDGEGFLLMPEVPLPIDMDWHPARAHDHSGSKADAEATDGHGHSPQRSLTLASV